MRLPTSLLASCLPVLSLLAGHAAAQQTASYSLFGDNCGAPCAALNDQRGPGRPGTLPNEYAYGHTFTQPTAILGFQFYTQTSALPVASMTCNVYRASTANPNAPADVAVASGTMTVTNVLDLYTVRLDQPVLVAANETIWISQLDSSNILAAAVTTGTPQAVPTYWRRTGLTWATTGIITFPAWRILCADNLAFYASGVPKLGDSMSLDVVGGPATSPAILLFGVNNPNLGIGLCTNLLADPTVLVTLVTGAGGDATFPLSVPNDPVLDGARVWNQWWLVGPGLSVVGTSGGIAFVGSL